MSWRSLLTDPALRDFVALEDGPRRIAARRGYERWARDAHAAAPAGAVEGGRAAHPLVPLPEGGMAVLRRYHRGGMVRHLNRDRYFFGHRAFEELRATERARAAGVRVPEILAAIEEGRGIGYGAVLASRWIPEVVGLDRWLAQATPERRSEALRLAGAQIGAMHAGGIAHPDINLRNLLVAEGAPLVYLIDFDRARIGERPVASGRRRGDLLRLARSATKLSQPFTPADWGALAAGYGDAWPLDRFLG